MELAIILEAVNSVLLLSLLYVYIGNYRELKNAFVLGLIVFAGFMLLQNLLALYFHFAMVDYYSKELMQHALVISGAQTIAL
ncbi:MAG TPA: hypothetical protein VJH23_03360, partial [archaeon]|nr:hypothetical protein [archaeon]